MRSECGGNGWTGPVLLAPRWNIPPPDTDRVNGGYAQRSPPFLSHFLRPPPRPPLIIRPPIPVLSPPFLSAFLSKFNSCPLSLGPLSPITLQSPLLLLYFVRSPSFLFPFLYPSPFISFLTPLRPQLLFYSPCYLHPPPLRLLPLDLHAVNTFPCAPSFPLIFCPTHPQRSLFPNRFFSR
jgi:hypothetical protein